MVHGEREEGFLHLPLVGGRQFTRASRRGELCRGPAALSTERTASVFVRTSRESRSEGGADVQQVARGARGTAQVRGHQSTHYTRACALTSWWGPGSRPQF